MKKFLFISLLLMAGLCTQVHANQNSCEVPACQADTSVPTFFIGAITFFTDMPELHYECTIELAQYERIEFNLPIASYLYVDPTGGRLEFTIDNESMMHWIYERHKEQGYYEMQVPIRGFDYSGSGVPWPTISRIGIIEIRFGD